MVDNNAVYDDEIDLMDIVAVLWKRKKMIAAGTLVVVIAALVYVTLAPEVYQIEMVVKPAVLEIDPNNKIVYATAPGQIKGRIESEIYGQKVLSSMARQKYEKLPAGLSFFVEVHKAADLVSIIYESSDIDFATKIQEELGKQLAADELLVLKNKKEFFERQIRMNQSDYQENANIEKSCILNVDYINKRIAQLTEDIARMKRNNDMLKKERKQLLTMKPDGTNSLSVLLYSNTIQQTLQLINEVKDQLTLQFEKKEEEIQKIISLKRERASISEEINYLKYKMGMMREMEIVSPPSAGEHPVKPKESIVVLAFVAGFFLMAFISFFVEGVGSYRRKVKNESPLKAV